MRLVPRVLLNGTPAEAMSLARQIPIRVHAHRAGGPYQTVTSGVMSGFGAQNVLQKTWLPDAKDRPRPH